MSDTNTKTVPPQPTVEVNKISKKILKKYPILNLLR